MPAAGVAIAKKKPTRQLRWCSYHSSREGRLVSGDAAIRQQLPCRRPALPSQKKPTRQLRWCSHRRAHEQRAKAYDIKLSKLLNLRRYQNYLIIFH